MQHFSKEMDKKELFGAVNEFLKEIGDIDSDVRVLSTTQRQEAQYKPSRPSKSLFTISSIAIFMAFPSLSYSPLSLLSPFFSSNETLTTSPPPCSH